MVDYKFARRVEVDGASVYDHAPGKLMLSAGSAFSPILPDVSSEATSVASPHTAIWVLTTSAKASADWAMSIARESDRRMSSSLACPGDF